MLSFVLGRFRSRGGCQSADALCRFQRSRSRLADFSLALQPGSVFQNLPQRRHVERAREMLHNPTLRVTDVAFAAGFQSIPHFNHTFKRYTGLSPNGYRASLRKP